MHVAEGDICDVCGFRASSIVGDCGHAACNVCWMGSFAVGACCVDAACGQANDRVRILVGHVDREDFLHSRLQDMFGSDYDSDNTAVDAEELGDSGMHDS